jgi:hypothetical protein
MNAGFGSWLLGMSLDAGMASGIFIVLAATTLIAAFPYRCRESLARSAPCCPRAAGRGMGRPACRTTGAHHHLVALRQDSPEQR